MQTVILSPRPVLRRAHAISALAVLLVGLVSTGPLAMSSQGAMIARRQTSIDDKDAALKKTFQDKAEDLSNKAKGWWERKEWAVAIPELDALLRDYDALPAVAKKECRWIAANIAYNLACGLSLDGKPDEAIVALRRAVEEFGYSSYANMKKDTDFDSIHTRPDFLALLDKVREVGDYLHILKSAPSYTAEPDKDVPKVLYQSKTAVELSRLRERYRLDEVAGKGNEVSRLKNLMLWVNRQVEHDGSSMPPPKRNAPALLDAAKEGKHGLNCRMMSTVLNDVLLAEGFATRHVTCMPKNPDDPDCHVINLVYCKSLAKWVWMDASFAGYWTDEAGILLSIAEVRERVIAGKPVKAALTLHHNTDPYTEAAYLDYMTKNMYWFTTPVASRFDYETDGKSRYMALVPPGGKHGWEGRSYYTSDPAAFWRKP